MAVTSDILATYRNPRAVMRRHLAGGAREDRALIFLFAACLLIFVAQWPRLSREAYLNPEVPLDARIGAALLGWMFIAPLCLYAIAAASHLVARAFGGRGTFFSARMALFWSLLAAAPLFLLHGLVAGFVGPGAGLRVTGLGVLAVFLGIWFLSLTTAERSPTPDGTPK